jgi:hypothetical protein
MNKGRKRKKNDQDRCVAIIIIICNNSGVREKEKIQLNFAHRGAMAESV